MQTDRRHQLSRLYRELGADEESGMSFSVGQTIGSHEILSLLGIGGMGEVYRARDTRLNREVALKILPASLAGDPDRLARFEREAQTLASLNHPNIAQIYGVEESDSSAGQTPSTASGQAQIRALVLELVDGETLADRIARGPLTLSDAFAVSRQLLEALHAAHARGIVHRDLKPSNIKVRSDGAVKVLDFGLAKALASDAPPGGDGSMIGAIATGRGMILGTAEYMAPEQARGKDADPRADIWAFGVILFEMLTGRPLFAGETLADTLGAVLYREPPWQAVPHRVQPVLRRCLEKSAALRFQDVDDVRASLESAREAPRRRGRQAWLAVTAAAVLTLLAGAFDLYSRERPAAPYPIRFQIPAPPQWTFANYFVVSPDGRRVAFLASESSGHRAIWIHSLESGTSTRLTRTGEVSSSSLFWSADGKSIGFVGEDAILKRIAIDGGPPQNIGTLPLGWGGAAWAPDDTVILGQRHGGLLAIAAKSGAARPLTNLDGSGREVGHGGPRLLPDGRHFIYSRASRDAAHSALYVGSVDLAPDEQPAQPLLVTDSRPVYAPAEDRRFGHVLAVRDGILLAYPFDAERLTITGDPVPVAENVGSVPNGSVSIATVSASPNGVLAYRTIENTSGVPLWIDRNGREIGHLTREPLDAPAFPRISPDGRRIAMIVDGNVWVFPVDGRPPMKLTFDGNLAMPIWSVDGTRILFEDHNNGRTALRSIAADRIAASEAASPEGRYFPFEWERDGSILAASFDVATTGNLADVDIVSFASGPAATPRAVVRTRAFEGQGGMALSPDRRWLAYTSNVTGRNEIWVQPYGAAGAPVRVSPNGGYQPRWSPRGNELYYAETNRLMAVPIASRAAFEAGAPVMVFENRFWTLGSFFYDVHPDGRFLVIASGPYYGTSPINVVVNWTALLGANRFSR